MTATDLDQPTIRRTEQDVVADAIWRLFARKLLPNKPHVARYACAAVGITAADLDAARERHTRGDVKLPDLRAVRPVELVANAGTATEAATRAKVSKKNPTPTTRRCSRCGLVQSRTAFNVKNRARGSLKSWCRSCQREYQHERYLSVEQGQRLRHVLRFVVRDGDQCVGANCPVCRETIVIGDSVQGETRLQHVRCKTR